VIFSRGSQSETLLFCIGVPDLNWSSSNPAPDFANATAFGFASRGTGAPVPGETAGEYGLNLEGQSAILFDI